jgi:hypothetical protein
MASFSRAGGVASAPGGASARGASSRRVDADGADASEASGEPPALKAFGKGQKPAGSRQGEKDDRAENATKDPDGTDRRAGGGPRVRDRRGDDGSHTSDRDTSRRRGGDAPGRRGESRAYVAGEPAKDLDSLSQAVARARGNG